MTVAKNIAFGMRLRRKPSREINKRVDELLELVSLPGMGNRYPYQMSGGQQQRVAVARALATEPRVLLLDEPLSSLDTGLRETMRTDLVRLFKQLKITAINVTHDQDEAMAMSDRIMVLREGQVQQVGTPTELYLHPINLFVASFMGPANLLSGELEEVKELAEVASIRINATPTGQKVVTGALREDVRKQLNGHALLMCRPDDVHLYSDETSLDLPNVIMGTVVYSSFVAGRWRTIIKTDASKSQAILAFASFQPQPDQKVWLELPPERCQIVAE